MKSMLEEVDDIMSTAETELEEREVIAARASLFNESLVRAAEERERREIEAYKAKMAEQKRLERLERKMKKRGQDELARMILERKARQAAKDEELSAEKGGLVSLWNATKEKAVHARKDGRGDRLTDTVLQAVEDSVVTSSPSLSPAPVDTAGGYRPLDLAAERERIVQKGAEIPALHQDLVKIKEGALAEADARVSRAISDTAT